MEKENIFFCRVEKNGEEKGGKYDGEGKIVADGQTGWTEIEGSTRGPRGPKNSRTITLQRGYEPVSSEPPSPSHG